MLKKFIMQNIAVCCSQTNHHDCRTSIHARLNVYCYYVILYFSVLSHHMPSGTCVKYEMRDIMEL